MEHQPRPSSFFLSLFCLGFTHYCETVHFARLHERIDVWPSAKLIIVVSAGKFVLFLEANEPKPVTYLHYLHSNQVRGHLDGIWLSKLPIVILNLEFRNAPI
jgi:hypothetical protein